MPHAAPTPRVAMFMSADVVGSTAFKAAAQAEDGSALWLEAFDTLFRELPLIFIGRVAAAAALREHVPQCGVWKVLGDEVVFIGLPSDLGDAEVLAAAFVQTVAAYDQRLCARWPLRIRGACWAAALGERNRVIEIPEMFAGRDGQAYQDFLGPDVDIGFRLSAHSAPGRVIVSPNLAESLAGLAESERLAFHPIGERSLKGVCGGQPFPLLLMSCASPSGSEPIGAPEVAPVPSHQLREQLAARREHLRAEHGAVMAPPVFAA